MSISSELLTLNNTKTAIRTAINNKGGSVGANDTFASYATAIDNLPSGGSGNPLLTSIDVSDFTGTTFNSVRTYITSATIPSGVTSIVNSAFYDCSSLTSINIPSGVTNIGQDVFNGCSSLTTLPIGNNVTTIGQTSYANMTGLTSITFPDSLTTVGYNCFSGDSNITEVNVSSLEKWCSINFTRGAGYRYSNPLALTQEPTLYANGTAITGSITLPNTLTSTGNGIFMNYNKITSVTIPSGVTSIGSDAFNTCSNLTSISLSSTVTSIGGYAFAYSGITSIDLPSSLTTIPEYMCSECRSLTTATIPASVTSIGTYAFQNCTALTGITILRETPPTLGNYALWGTNNCPIYVPAASVATYQSASGWSSYSSRIQAIPE